MAETIKPLVDAPLKTLFSADKAVCADCLREMRSPRDRRFHYPFISCASCGPRFTLLGDFPGDREHTSMASFRMCGSCQSEYNDPLNRRFQAQAIACWDCGPQLQLWSSDGSRVDTAEPIRDVARLLERDGIVAIKDPGGFHLACNARSEVAVNLLRERKNRVERPFAVMFRRIEDIERLCVVDDTTRALLPSPECPVVLLPRQSEVALPVGIAPNQRFLGASLPYTPLQHLLFSSTKLDALVLIGGDRSGEPIATDNQEAVQRLQGIADAFLVHNHDIQHRCDDSVVRIAAGRTQQLQRSRGFVPVPISIERSFETVLSVGGESENTVCVLCGSDAFLSQHIGNLENLESYKFFQECAEHLQRLLEIHPKIVAHDLHPDYFSTKWALAREGVQLVAVQHHHAHIAACMAENHLDGKVIGVVLDGGGYGTDGAIWGGEVLLADYHGFERAAHFEYIPLPGGTAANLEPWRTTVSYLSKHYGKNLPGLDLAFLKNIDPRRLQVVQQMIEGEIHSPRTSSCVRLLDAVAALAGARYMVNYESQAAIEFETVAYDSSTDGAYPFDLMPDGAHWQIGTRALFDAILGDIRREESVANISRKFHAGLAQLFANVAEKIRDQSKLNRVCLSGSCFQNALLFELLLDALRAKSFEVYFHSEAPINDGGLSLGQALIAAHRTQV